MTTRAERLTELLQDVGNDYVTTFSDIVEQILAIADDREFVSLKGFAELIGRDPTTILSWKQRGQHDVPAIVTKVATWNIWDADEIREWAAAHPDLVR